MSWDWFIWALATAGIWGFMPFFEKQAVDAINNQYTAVLVRTVGVALGFILIPLIHPPVIKAITEVPLKAWICLLISGFAGSIIGQITYLKAMKMGEVSRVTPVASAWPLLAVFIAVIFLGEPFTAKKAIAVCLTVSGLILLRI
jgi:bacterial/archaeal transporter family protein